MENNNLYAEHIENYDLDSLISIARTATLDGAQKSQLIDAIETTLSYLDYEYDCRKMSDIGSEYLEAVECLGQLKGAKDYLGISRYYFLVLEVKKTSTKPEREHWLNLLENNLKEALSKFPENEEIISSQIHFLKVRSKEYEHVNAQVVQSLFECICSATKRFPNSNFWTTWIYTLIDLQEVNSERTVELTKQSQKDLLNLRENLFASKQLDPIQFYRQIGQYNFLKTLPAGIKTELHRWIHEAIAAEQPNLTALSNDFLRDQGILFINAYENHLANDEVIEHAVALNSLSWERFPNWNSLLFYLRAKMLHALHLKKNGNATGCLALFAEANQQAERVRSSLDLNQKDNFSFASPLLEFYQQYALETPLETQRKELVQIRFEIAEATIATGEGSYLFPYEHHLACAAYLSLPEAFKRSWMQMCIVLCMYAHSIYEHWKDDIFVKNNESLNDLLKRSAFLFSKDQDINVHTYHKKYPVILHALSTAELDAEFDRLLKHFSARGN